MSLIKSSHAAMTSRSYETRCYLFIATVVIAFITSVAAAQARIDIPDNKYSLNCDVRIGGQANAEIEKQLPLIPERSFSENYIDGVGRRLVRAIRLRYRHREFVYRFDVVNVRDVNAFAIPGGPLYMNRGLIEAKASEGQVAGLMAHELAHIALLHNTVQVTEAQSVKFRLRGNQQKTLNRPC